MAEFFAETFACEVHLRCHSFRSEEVLRRFENGCVGFFSLFGSRENNKKGFDETVPFVHQIIVGPGVTFILSGQARASRDTKSRHDAGHSFSFRLCSSDFAWHSVKIGSNAI